MTAARVRFVTCRETRRTCMCKGIRVKGPECSPGESSASTFPALPLRVPRRVLHDRFFKQAKAEGYLARSAYKLIEIDDRKRLLRKGDRVLDLGCAPGSWLQVAGERVGPSGAVIGIDLQAVTHPMPAHIRHAVMDAFTADPGVLTGEAGGMFDVVLSDMAPNTTGAGDHFRSYHLCRRVIELLPGLLRIGGNLAMKVFEGEKYPELLRHVGRRFREVKGFKPRACRDVSSEIYVIGHGYTGEPVSAGPGGQTTS